MAYVICKEFRWEMGHRLAPHPGDCRHIHGHSYRAAIQVTGDLNEMGMVIDFGALGQIARPLVDQLDHALLLWKEDEPWVSFFQSQGQKLVLMDTHPTTEHLAAWWAHRLKEALQDHSNLHQLTVTIHESQTAWAAYSLPLR